MQPLIAITCSRKIGGAWGEYDAGHFMDYTFCNYSRAVAACGGAPVLIPTDSDQRSLHRILRAADGLLLSGGPDVHPGFYGEEPIPGLGEIDEPLDRMEIAAVRAALAENLPVLAVCRGIQVLNIALGGTVYQDIGSQVPEAIGHRQQAAKSVPTHSVRIERPSLLFDILRRRNIRVNGRHHQAVKDVAEGLQVAGRAPDGLVEAVFSPRHPFVLGVQWHPEGLFETDPLSRKLFSAFVKAAKSTER
ncbi:MAG: gamma-glutamyl-gamma-aminobutyrate hydrolase family protein [Desulfobacterales bacterium]